MPKISRKKEEGFILIIMLFLMVLLAVTALALNSQTALQARMAANQSDTAQSYFGALAVIDQSLWKLTADPCWRLPGEEQHVYQGVTYNRTVVNSALSSYQDVVTISVRSPNASRQVKKSFRYHIETPFQVRNPRQVSLDGAGNIFFADMDNHSVWRIDAISGAITRVAGTGRSGFSGDGGPATDARLDSPRGVSVDQAGNIYIADTNNNRIRRVTAGIITTAGGGGNPPSGIGDGGAATMARLNSPYGVAVDASGNIYIADRDYHRIRKVTSGIITTVAGTSGGGGFAGDGGPATAAQLNSPRGIFVDNSGDIFIADTDNHRIRKVTVATGTINTVAGSFGWGDFSGDGGLATEARFNNPRSVFVNNAGNIFIADTDNNRIRKVMIATGIITTIAGTGTAGYGVGGQATSAQINHPTGVWAKSTGELIFSDTDNSCLRKVDTANIISTFPQTTQRLELNDPKGISSYYDADYKRLLVFIADRDRHRIRMFDAATNIMVHLAGTGAAGFSGDNSSALNAQLNGPEGIATFYDAGQQKLFLYIADTVNNRIRKVEVATLPENINNTVIGNITTVAGGGNAMEHENPLQIKLLSPKGVFVDAARKIYIADTGNHKIRMVSTGGIATIEVGTGTGGFSGDGGLATDAKLNAPARVCLDAAGNLYIADTNNNRIRKVTAADKFIMTIVGGGNPLSGVGDEEPATSAKLNLPEDVAVDGAGNIYIADTGNHTQRIVNIHANPPTIHKLAGVDGTSGYNGDNQPAVTARLDGPAGIALGQTKAGGRIFISDANNNRIRMLFLKTAPEVYGP